MKSDGFSQARDEHVIPVLTRQERTPARRGTSGRPSAALRLIAVVLIADLGFAWSLMTAAGVAHGSWWHLMPAMSYAAALGTVTAVAVPVTLVVAVAARLN
jgi:hypothetical protein